MNDITGQTAALESLQQLKENLEIRVAERTAELETVNRRLRMASMEDALTKLANRRWFNTTIDREIRRARRNGDSLSLLMIDVDFFKQYNDRYGHIKGDACLKKIGGGPRETFRRAEDLPCRYGGEEFAVILPGIAAEDALALAERLRRKIERLSMPHDASVRRAGRHDQRGSRNGTQYLVYDGTPHRQCGSGALQGEVGRPEPGVSLEIALGKHTY
jgi:diguanylate cyclase (GGDEF)-like protein